MPDQRDALIARLMTLSAVGTEMAAPIVAGWFTDSVFGWMPICTIIGALLGLVGGIYHLIVLNRPKSKP